MEFNIAQLFAEIAHSVGDREAVVAGRRLTYAELDARSDAVARFLQRSVRKPVPRTQLRPWESGQSHVGLMMINHAEHVESLLGCLKARAVPININYRYTSDELSYLLKDARIETVFFDASFAITVAEAVAAYPHIQIVEIGDAGSKPTLDEAYRYDGIVAAETGPFSDPGWDPDDLYILYTGGTTGFPKGTLWRQADLFVAALNGFNRATKAEYLSSTEVLSAAAFGDPRALVGPPLMHGAGQWHVLATLLAGGTVCFPRITHRFDPADFWETVERERTSVASIIGDAFGLPLLEQLDRQPYELSALRVIVTGGAALRGATKERLLKRLPWVQIVDTSGASETGPQLTHLSTASASSSSGTFHLRHRSCLLSGNRSRILSPDEREIGWVATTGRIPLGYLNDPEKTAQTFPEVDGRRFAVPGDRACHLSDGRVELLGREAVTINSGGEKIFAEEVERAVARHPAVRDVLVVGRPSERWGQEVVALIHLRDSGISDDELLAVTAATLAPYKRPRALIRVRGIHRSPAGKADYGWAQAVAAGGDVSSIQGVSQPRNGCEKADHHQRRAPCPAQGRDP